MVEQTLMRCVPYMLHKHGAWIICSIEIMETIQMYDVHSAPNCLDCVLLLIYQAWFRFGAFNTCMVTASLCVQVASVEAQLKLASQ